MDELSVIIGKNIRKYRRLKGLTIEELAEILGTETNYLGQCERGVRRFSLDKLVDLIGYFGVTADDIIPVAGRTEEQSEKRDRLLQGINDLLAGCSSNQLAVVLNVLEQTVPFLKD